MTNEPRNLRLGIVQSACAEAREENLQRAARGIGEAAARGAELVLLQELFATRYFCQSHDPDRFALAERVPGPTCQRLAALAREHGVALVASLFERRGPGLGHNTAVAIDERGELVGMYRKLHIPDDPLYHEKFYFAPGDTGFLVFELAGARVAPLICWDQWYPEAIRCVALRGAEVVVIPTAIGRLLEEEEAEGEAQRDAWETVQRGHAIANGLYLAAANRVGREGGLEFWGSSFVADPFGRVIARAGSRGDEVLVVECDLDRIARVRREWPFLRDRRIDAYGGILRRWGKD